MRCVRTGAGPSVDHPDDHSLFWNLLPGVPHGLDRCTLLLPSWRFVPFWLRCCRLRAIPCPGQHGSSRCDTDCGIASDLAMRHHNGDWSAPTRNGRAPLASRRGKRGELELGRCRGGARAGREGGPIGIAASRAGRDAAAAPVDARLCSLPRRCSQMIRSSGSFLPGPANRIEEDPAAADGRAPWLDDGWIGRDEQRLSRIAAIFAAAAAPECHVFLAFLSSFVSQDVSRASQQRTSGEHLEAFRRTTRKAKGDRIRLRPA